jgi:hypothetical protein
MLDVAVDIPADIEGELARPGAGELRHDRGILVRDVEDERRLGAAQFCSSSSLAGSAGS